MLFSVCEAPMRRTGISDVVYFKFLFAALRPWT